MTQRPARKAPSGQPLSGQPPEMLPGLRASVADAQAKARDTRARKAIEVEIAATDPVARVLIDLPLAHLDRPFDYAVPAAWADDVQPGVRVKVRFAGQDVDAFVLARAAHSDHTGRLTPLRRLVSAERVLSPAVAEAIGEVARRYAGTRSDVLRLALPPRHATTEKKATAEAPPARPTTADVGWRDYPHADPFLTHLSKGGSPRAVWTAAPGDQWPAMIADAVASTSESGRGSLICLPDVKDVARLDAALVTRLGPGQHVTLTADAGPAARYRDFLAVSRGLRQIVIGTRSAAFAPVRDLGLVAIWEDGDDLHQEPRAPYPHARETLLIRAALEDTAALLGSFSRSAEAQQLLHTGWARELALPRDLVRRRLTVTIAGATDVDLARDPGARVARIPKQVHDLIRSALASGPVLIQTPRAGYALSLACDRCRTPARCDTCAGPLGLTDPTSPPACQWCATAADPWSCAECGGRGLRAPILGEARTAEELGRSFPGARVRSSSRDQVLATVSDDAAIVVATPGAEPIAEGGYAAVCLLDTWQPLTRPGFRAAEEALRRWSAAVGLLRPGGRAIAVGDPAHQALQSLLRWDHAGFAEREIAERQAAHLPPASRVATIIGDPGAVDDAVTLLDLPEVADVLGPVPLGDGEDRVVIRVPRSAATHLATALAELQRVRSSRKLTPVRIQVDPYDL